MCGSSDVVGACSASAAGADLDAAISGFLGGDLRRRPHPHQRHVHRNHAGVAGGAVYAVGDVVSTNSTFTDNSAGLSGEVEGNMSGGAIAGESAITVDGSTFTGNFLGDENGTCALCIIVGHRQIQADNRAAALAPVVTATGSTFADNHADCEYYCITQGGAIGADSVTTSGSSFTGNSVNLGNCDLGNDSSFCAAGRWRDLRSGPDRHGIDVRRQPRRRGGLLNEGCYNQGGALAAFDLSLTGTTVTGNTATCDTNSAAYGGGIVAGRILAVGSADVHGFSGSGSAPDGVFAQAPAAGTVSITQSNVSGNAGICDTGDCGASGGGLLSLDSDSVDISASTFSGNTAGYGGAVAVYQEGTIPVTITNSTVTGNSTWFFGALDLADADANARLRHDRRQHRDRGSGPARRRGDRRRVERRGREFGAGARPASHGRQPHGGHPHQLRDDRGPAAGRRQLPAPRRPARPPPRRATTGPTTRRAASPTPPTRWPPPTTRNSTPWAAGAVPRPRCCR